MSTPPERDPDTGAPIWARNEAGQPICGYPTPKLRNRTRGHDICHDTQLGQNGRCRRGKHGGNKPMGDDHPNTTTGEYSKSPQKMVQRVLAKNFLSADQGNKPSKTGEQIVIDNMGEFLTHKDDNLRYKMTVHLQEAVDGKPDQTVKNMLTNTAILDELAGLLAEKEGEPINAIEILEALESRLVKGQ